MKRWVLVAFSKCKKEILFSFICILLLTCSMIACPIGLKYIVNKFESDSSLKQLIIGIVIMLGIYLIQTGVTIIWNLSLDQLGGKFIMYLSDDLMKKLVNSDYIDVEAIGINKVKSILFSDVFDCFRIFGNFIPTIVSSFFILSFCVAYSFTIEITTTIIIICACLVGLFLTIISRKRLNFVGKKTNIALKEIHALDVDFCDNINETKTNQLLGFQIDKNERSMNHFIKTAKKEDFRSFFWSGIISSYNAIISISVSMFVAFYTKANIIQNILFYTVLTSLIISSIERMENSLHCVFKLKNSIDNVSLIYSINEYDGKDEIKSIDELNIKNLTYGFIDNIVLNDVSLSFKKGDLIKLEGVNGSGKSTLIKLLLQVYFAPKNTIMVNGMDYRKISMKSYLSRILYVGQDEKIQNVALIDYHKNIIENLDLKKYEELMSFLDLDFNKEITDNGLNLSAGQRKKVLLVKLFMSFMTKDVIILDELFASLDQKTKEYLSSFINDKLKDKIVIIVNHEDDEINYTKRISMTDLNIRLAENKQ